MRKFNWIRNYLPYMRREKGGRLHLRLLQGTPRQMKIIQIVRHYVEAKEIISNWAKDGAVIVRPQIAATRAAICIKCPLNIRKGFASRLVATFIRWAIEWKYGTTLTLPKTQNLGRCSVCYCESDLKIWLPLENIKPADSERKKYDENCWLFKMH